MIKTNTASPIEVHKMVSPKLNVNAPTSYAAVLGPKNIIYQKFQSQSFSNSQANINCVFNSQSLVDVSTAVVGSTLKTTFTGKSAGPGIPLLQMKGAKTAAGIPAGTLNRDAPRAYPLAQILSSLQCQIENDTPSSNVNQYWNCLSRFYNDKESQDMYQCPAMLDIVQNYEDLPDFSAVDPLNNWINNSTQRTRGGGGVSNLTILRNDSTGAPGDTAIVEFTTYEPIYLSPFNFGSNRKQQQLAKPLCGLNTLIINMTFNAQSNLGFDGLSRIWSHNPSTVGGASTFSNINVSVEDVFVNMSYYQAPLTYPIRSGIGSNEGYSYPYVEYLLLPTTLSQTVAPGAIQTIQMNTTKLSAVPGKLFIWVSRDPSTQNLTTTDTAFAITDGGLSLTFNGQDGILSACTAQQLHEISKINGLVDNFDDFMSNVGSFMCLKFGQDINLPSDLVPGCSGNFDLSMKITVRNVNGTQSIKPQLNVLVQYEGVYSVVGTSWSRSIGPINSEMVLELQSSEHGFRTYNSSEMLNGGSIFSSIGNFFKKPLVKTIARTLWSTVNPSSYGMAQRACEGNNSGVCKFVRGDGVVMEGYGEGYEGEGTIIGGARKSKRCPTGKVSRCVDKQKLENLAKARAAKAAKARGRGRTRSRSRSRASSRSRSRAGSSRSRSRSAKKSTRKSKRGGAVLSYEELKRL